jgi:hypothetical protein
LEADSTFEFSISDPIMAESHSPDTQSITKSRSLTKDSPRLWSESQISPKKKIGLVRLGPALTSLDVKARTALQPLIVSF